ncbi:hypothetical protein HDU86_008136 [Geranomyces michiganensis]|nr:hypothetical protein HDU86_008136 [Geranomyces michiganensis]
MVLDLPPSDGAIMRDMKSKALKCMQSWAQYGVPLSTLGPLIHKVMNLLPEPHLFDHAMDALIELIGCPNVKAFAASLSVELLEFITADSTMTNALPPQMAMNIVRGAYAAFFLDQIRWLLPSRSGNLETLEEDGVFDHPGADGVDFYTDSVTGCPVFRDGGVNEHDDGRIAVINIAPARNQNRDENAALSHVAKDVFYKLVEILLAKTAFPEQFEWDRWPQGKRLRRRYQGTKYLIQHSVDIKDRFTHFRRDSADLLLTCFYVLRNKMMEFLVTTAVRQLREVQMQLIPWQTLESTLHAIKAISDAAEPDEAVYLATLFGKGFLDQLSGALETMPARLHFTTALLIGSLVSEADTLVALWTQVGPSLEPVRKSRLVKAVANVIGEMPNELMLSRLWILLNSIVGDIVIALNGYHQNPAEGKEHIVSQLMCLKFCCAGLQSNEVTEYNGLPLNDEQDVAAGVIFDMASRCCAIFASDMDVMEVLCNFMSQSINSTISIFTPKLRALVSLIVDTYARNPIAHLLDVAVAVCASYGPRAKFLSAQERGEITRLLHGLSLVTLKLFEHQDMQTYTDIVQSYFDLLRRSINLCPWALAALPQDVVDGIFSDLSLKGFSMQERLALNTLLDFLITFVGQHYEESDLTQLVQYVISRISQHLVFLLIQAIGGQQPRSMDDRLADTLFRLNMRYPDLTRTALITCLAQVDFPTNRVSAAEKEAFVKTLTG